MGLSDHKNENLDSLELFETAPKLPKSKKSFRTIHSFFSLKKTSSQNLSTIPEPIFPKPKSKPNSEPEEEGFESFSGPLSEPPNQKPDQKFPYQKSPATFPRPSSSPSILSLPEKKTETFSENSPLSLSPKTTNIPPSPPPPSPPPPFALEDFSLPEFYPQSPENFLKNFSLPESDPQPTKNFQKFSSLPESPPSSDSAEMFPLPESQNSLPAKFTDPLPAPEIPLPVEKNPLPETASKAPRRRSWCASESHRPNFTNYSKKGGMGGTGTIVPVGILPTRVNTIREHAVEGGEGGIIYGHKGGIGSVSAHFVRHYGKEEDEEGEGEGEGEGKGEGEGENVRKYKRDGRRQSLEYSELEAVKERLTQAACLWKGLSGEIFLEDSQTFDSFSVADDEEALHRAVMAELERKRCPMKMRVSVGAMGKDKGALRKWAFKKWFGRVKAKREGEKGEK